MNKEFDKRFKELYDQNCDPGPYKTMSEGMWYAILMQTFQEIEAPKIILKAFGYEDNR